MAARIFFPHLLCLIIGVCLGFSLQAQVLGLRQPPSPEQQRQMKIRLQEELKNADSDTLRVRLKMQIAGLTVQGNTTEALQLAKEALALAEKTNHTETIARAYFGAANIQMRSNRYDDALQYLNDGLPAAEKLENPDLLSNYYNQFGQIYQERGVYEKALAYYRKANDALQKTAAPPIRKAGVLNQIGMILHKTGKHRDAASYLEKAGTMAEQARIWDMADGIWNNLANCHDALNEPQEAEAARAKSRACVEQNKKKAMAPASIKSGSN